MLICCYHATTARLCDVTYRFALAALCMQSRIQRDHHLYSGDRIEFYDVFINKLLMTSAKRVRQKGAGAGVITAATFSASQRLKCGVRLHRIDVGALRNAAPYKALYRGRVCMCGDHACADVTHHVGHPPSRASCPPWHLTTSSSPRGNLVQLIN